MIARHLRRLELLGGIAALGVMAGCSSDTTGGNMHPVQFSFTTHVAAAPGAIALASDQAVDPAGNLVLSNVQLVFRKVELDPDGTADCVGDVQNANNDNADDDHGRNEGECEMVSRDPIFLDIPVDGTLHPSMKIPVAAGTFREIQAKLGPARDVSTAFNTAHPELVGNSVRVRGTIMHNGALVPFDFRAPVRAKLEMEFDPPLVIDATTTNATISLNVANWFLDSAGNVIDPTTATPGSANLALIENNIRRSFHAFEDDHERGEDHHEGHGGSDDGSGHT